MSNKINQIFKAIADPTRREIFNVLAVASTALSITQISDQFEMTRQGVSKHLKLLHDAGMVDINQVGRERFCSANALPLKEVNDWVKVYEHFWANKLKDLGNYLDQQAPGKRSDL